MSRTKKKILREGDSRLSRLAKTNLTALERGVNREENMSFHVPELSRGGPMTHPALHGERADGNNGAFDVESPEPGWRLALVASDGEGWEHVSIHAYNTLRTKQRTPTWKEMSYVKRLCWDADDVVMQLHPRESQYVNCHPHVLHLWRPTDRTIPEPPSILVGPLTGENDYATR